MDIGRELAQLRSKLEEVERAARLRRASLDNTAIVVKDDSGTVRGHIGMQADGTLGLIAVDGPAPGAPSAPVVTPSLGGLRITWDGQLADGSLLPADFDHVAVHVATSSGFTPSAATFVGTITRAGDGGMLPVTPLPYLPHFVVLTAVNTSAAASGPSSEVTATPLKVDSPDLTAGSVTAAAIHSGAVTADKLEAILTLATRLVAGDPAGARVELNSDGLRVYNGSGTLVIRFDSVDGSAVFTGAITGSTITGGAINGSTITGAVLQTAASGERITLNEGGTNKILVYNSSGTVIGELSAIGLQLKGTTNASAWIDPSAALPQLRFDNAAGNNTAFIQMADLTGNDANIQLVAGKFTADTFTDRAWRMYMGNDFAIIERIRRSNSTAHRGGRLNLGPNSSDIGHMDSTSTANAGYFNYQAGLITGNGRLVVQPGAASASNAAYVNAFTGHTGALLRLALNAVDKFVVDKDGNTTTAGNASVTGNVTVTGTLTSSDSDHGTVNAVLSSAASVDVTVTFNKTFATAPHVVACLAGNPTLPSGSSALTARPFNITTTGCSIRVNDVAGTARSLTHRVDWIARS